MQNQSAIVQAIDNSPLNRGLVGADWIADPANVAIVRGADVTLFDWEAHGIFQIHVLYQSRGRAALASAKQAIDEIFTQHPSGPFGILTVFAMVPDFRRDVKMLARWAGMKFAGKRSTPHGMCELYVISKESFR